MCECVYAHTNTRQRFSNVGFYWAPNELGLYRNFPHYQINGTIVEKVIKNEMCFDVVYRLSETFLSNSNKKRRFSDNILILNIMKISSVGAELLHADRRTSRWNTHRRTDKTKLMVAFPNYANSPKICYIN